MQKDVFSKRLLEKYNVLISSWRNAILDIVRT